MKKLLKKLNDLFWDYFRANISAPMPHEERFLFKIEEDANWYLNEWGDYILVKNDKGELKYKIINNK